MSASNLKSASQRPKRNESPRNRPPKSISRAKNRSANVQSAAERFLKLRIATFVTIRRPTGGHANSNQAKQFSVRTFQRSRPRSSWQREKPISSTVSSRKEDAHFPPT